MTKDEILALAEFDDSEPATHRLRPIILALATANEKLVAALEEVKQGAEWFERSTDIWIYCDDALKAHQAEMNEIGRGK